MKKQLTQMQDDINILKGNKTAVKGMDKFVSLGRNLFLLLRDSSYCEKNFILYLE